MGEKQEGGGSVKKCIYNNCWASETGFLFNFWGSFGCFPVARTLDCIGESTSTRAVLFLVLNKLNKFSKLEPWLHWTISLIN